MKRTLQLKCFPVSIDNFFKTATALKKHLQTAASKLTNINS